MPKLQNRFSPFLSRCFSMLCLACSVDQVDEVLADLCSLLGFTLNSCHGVKLEPTLLDVKETFCEENYSTNEEAFNYGGEDFIAEQSSEDNSDDDYVPKSKRIRNSSIKNEEDEDVNDNKFAIRSSGENSTDDDSDDEYVPEKGRDNKWGEKRKKDRDRMRLWRKEGKRPEKPKRDKKLEKEGKLSNTPVVWIKEPSPERLLNGKKTKYYFMPEGNFEEGSPYKCLICDYKSISTRDIRLHFHRLHLKEKLYKCIECDMRGVSWSAVLNHWNRIHNPNREELLKFVCETCGKKYQEKSELKIHLLVHGNSKYPCKYCGKGFKTPYLLKSHESCHEKEPVPCNICGKMLSGPLQVKEHERVVHFNEATVDCELCGKTLKTKRNLHLHMRSVHGTVEKNHHCDRCQARFRVASMLRKHIETVHEKTRLFPCPYCKSVLSSKDKFKLHSKRLHEGRDLPPELKEQMMKPRIENFRVKVNASE